MKFLIVTQYFEPEVGAPQIRLANFTKELRAQGHDVEVVTAMPHYPDAEIFASHRGRFLVSEPWDQDPAVTIHRVWLKAGGGQGLARLVSFASFSAMLPFALRKASRPDVVVVNSPLLHTSPPALLAARVWGAKTFLYAADLWPDSLFDMVGGGANPLLARLLYGVERGIYRAATGVIAVTEGIEQTLRNEKALPAHEVSFLPNGVDLDAFSPAIEPARPPALEQVDGPLFVFAGTLGYFTGLDIVVDAMTILQTERPDISFGFVGEGPERERIQQRVIDEGLTNITFAGKIQPEEVASLLRSCTAGVVCLKDAPVTRGARPAKTFPIMASAVPVIFVGVGEGPRLISEANAGLCVEPEDTVGLAKAMIQLADDEAAREHFGQAGREYVTEHLSWARLVRDWLADLRAHGHIPSVEETSA